MAQVNDLDLYFRYRCEKGLQKRGLADKQEYVERLNHEISTIAQMGYCGYFLIVSDILTWALRNGIPVGPGRGSAAGSLVAYALEITHLDPIQYGLIFERFLNPHRVSMPDIDMDFCEERRNEVIEYVEHKYGHDRVARIGTYGTMKAKGSIRDVARTLGYPYEIGDGLAKLTLAPIEGKPQPLSTCYEKVPELRKVRFGGASRRKDTLVWAEKVENRIRSFGTHASGVVISQQPIDQSIPLYPGKDGVPTTQFEMYTVEDVGLIKFDFLGLRALTTIQRCVDMVQERHGTTIDPLKIPVDDEKTFQLLRSGDVTGVFQLEGSSGIRDLAVQIQPNKLEDISLLVAVYRPGPLSSDMFKHYLLVKTGQAEAQYTVDALKPILEETDGMLIYQEQILEICKQLAGYSMGEADLMRRAVGKKKEKEMAAQETKFKQGMQAYGIPASAAEKIWNDIKAFASYGFNKAHSACYAYIGYQMAWLKTHYPVEFMCSCLISDSDEADKVIQYISYCKGKGIQVLAPDINESQYSFSVGQDDMSIRFGLTAVKNLGKPVQEIIDERNARGPFADILDFCSRMSNSRINSRQLESLVLAGAFDHCGQHTRASQIAAIEDLKRYKKERASYDNKIVTYAKRMAACQERQMAIEAWESHSKEDQRQLRKEGVKQPKPLKIPEKVPVPKLPTIPTLSELPVSELLAKEKELLGYYVSGHPLDMVKEATHITISEIKEEGKENQRVRLIAIPSTIKEITTKSSKKKMAYVDLEDKTGTIQATVFSQIWAKCKEQIDVYTPALYDASIEVTEIDTPDGEVNKVCKLRLRSVRELPSLKELEHKAYELVVPFTAAQQAAQLINSQQGNDFRVTLIMTAGDNQWNLGTYECAGTLSGLEHKLQELA